MSWNDCTPYIIHVKTFDSQMIRKDQRKNEYEFCVVYMYRIHYIYDDNFMLIA